jgi:hypothetical protein
MTDALLYQYGSNEPPLDPHNHWSDNTFKKVTIVGYLVLTFSLFFSLKNIDCLYSLAGFLFNFPLD